MGTFPILGVLLYWLIYILEHTRAEECSDTALKMDPGLAPYSVGNGLLRVELHCYLCFDTSKQYSANSMEWTIQLDKDAAVTQWVWGLQMTPNSPSTYFTFVNRKRFQTSEDPFKWRFHLTYEGTVDYSTNPPTFSASVPSGHCSATGTRTTLTTQKPITSTARTSISTEQPTTTTTSAPVTQTTSQQIGDCGSACVQTHFEDHVWTSNGFNNVKGKCVISLGTNKLEENELEMKLVLDTPVFLQQWAFRQVSSDSYSSSFTVTNSNAMSVGDPFQWEFIVQYSGSTKPTAYCFYSIDGSSLTTITYPRTTSTSTLKSTSTTFAPSTASSTASSSNSASTTSTSKATSTVAPPSTTTSTFTTTTSPRESTTTSQEQANFDICQQEVNAYNGRYNLHEVLCKSILFYEAQRAGALPSNQRVSWRKDSALDDGKDNGVDLSRGWFDAGDYMKFNLPMSMSLTTLTWGFIQWRDAYEAAGQTDHMFDSIQWPLDYLYNCWQPETKTFYGQVGIGNADHGVMERVEEMTTERPSWPTTSSNPGTEVSASGAAALAAGAIAFTQRNATYSAMLLSAAKSLFEFADTYRGTYTISIQDAASFYNSWSGFGDELVMAAAMLHKATGDVSYLTRAEALFNEFLSGQTFWSYDWDNQGLGATLLLYQATQDPNYSVKIVKFLADYGPNGGITYTNKGLAWRAQWGSLRYSANAAFVSLMANESGIPMQSSFLDPEQQIGYMLGDTGRSFVVGFGTNPPKRPHHKSSTCPPAPAPCGWDQFYADTDNYYTLYGALVGGPDSSDYYEDNRNDYEKNEVATDYNAGFQSAIAGLISRGMLR